MYLFVKFFAVEEVEDLHHDEGVEDKCEVSGDDFVFCENWVVVMLPTDCSHSSASNCASDDTVCPLVFWVVGEQS